MRISDWSSDVCSSDLAGHVGVAGNLRKRRPHAVEHRDNRPGRPEVGVLVYYLKRGVVNRPASLAVDLLPVIAEEAHDRAGACVEEVLLQGVHEAGVSVLILIDQQNWIARGHHGPKLGPCEERGHEREHVLVPQRHFRFGHTGIARSEEHTSELQSLMRISYAVFCLKKNNSTTRE